jgi:uncharacterized membrane protein YfcA
MITMTVRPTVGQNEPRRRSAIFLLAARDRILSGATAAIAGFGIGSLLTPLLALHMDMGTAVAAVSIPHAVATSIRCWRLWDSIDWVVLRRFGLVSAAGSLAGALLYARLGGPTLTAVLGLLLILTAVAGLSGWTSRVMLRGLAVPLFGLLSGFWRPRRESGRYARGSASAFRMAPLAFVATATATGVLVDAARAPVYVWHAGTALVALAAPISIATTGVVIGTIAGERVLLSLSRDRFRVIISALIGLLGLWLLATVLLP